MKRVLLLSTVILLYITAPLISQTFELLRSDNRVISADELLLSFQKKPETIIDIDQLIQLALEQSRQLDLQLGMVRYSKAQLENAYAQRLPTIDFSLQGSYLTTPQEAVIVEQGSLATTPISLPSADTELFPAGENSYFQMKTEINQPIFTWGKIDRGIDLALLEEQISQLRYAKTESEIEIEVKKAYASYTLAKQSKQILDRLIEYLSQSYIDRQNQFSQGNINRQTLLEAQSLLAQVQYENVQAQEFLLSALRALEFYTGHEIQQDQLHYSFRDSSIELDLLDLENSILQNNFDLTELYLKRSQAEASVQLEEAGQIFHPDLGANITLDINGQSVPFTDNWTDTWNVNLIITLGTDFTILDFGRSWSTLEQAQAQLDQANAGYEEFLLSIPLQLQQRMETIRINYSNIHNQEILLELRKEEYNNARVNFENELITRENMRGAAILLSQTYLNYLTSIYSYEISLIELEHFAAVDLK